MDKIIMLGTGHATVTQCFNTCFVVERTIGGHTDRLLVDGGGGNGILRQLQRAGIAIGGLHHLFVTHAHTDHIMGCLWVVRMAMQQMLDGRYDGELHVWSHAKCLDVLSAMCRMMLHRAYSELIGRRVVMHCLHDGEEFCVGQMRLQCFDIHSKMEPQMGFVLFGEGHDVPAKRLVCLGDEPYNELCRPYVEGAEWLMSEAFCLYSDRATFDPYGKYHSTALDAGREASQLNVNHLVLYHTEDRHLDSRRAAYTAEAAIHYGGSILVPDDLESFVL